MKKIGKLLAGLALLMFLSTKAQAQLGATMYHMKDLPLTNQLNPAFQPKNGSIYISIPFIPFFAPTSIGGALQGENLTAGNWFFNPNYEAVALGDGDFGMGEFNFSYSPISFGFMVKDMYFTFDAKFSTNVQGRITKDLERLFWYGNGADETLGQPLTMEGLGATVTAYAEIALGFSKEILKDQLTMGGKLKYLQGLGLADIGMGEGSYIYTDPNSYNITVGFNPDIHLSGVSNAVPNGVFTLDSLFNDIGYKFKSDNKGFAFDLGGSWDLPWVKGLNVSASVLNIGFINWKGNRIVAANPNKTFTFEGFDVSESGKDFASQLLDSIKQTAELTATYGSQKKWLYPTIYFGANYEVLKHLNVGALFGYQLSKYENLPMFALSANTQGFMVNLSAAYSYYNNNHNLGIGAVFGRRAVQWYLMTDNLLAININKAQDVNFRMGMNLLFGKSRAQRKELAAATLAPSGMRDPMQRGPKVEESVTPEATKTGTDDTPQAKTNTTGNNGKPAATTELSKEELLKKALAEEAAEGDAVQKE